jgi:hypothetical protein
MPNANTTTCAGGYLFRMVYLSSGKNDLLNVVHGGDKRVTKI